MIRATATWTPRADSGRFVETVIAPAALDAAQGAGEVCLQEALAIVPRRTGELADSGHVETVETGKTAVATVAFGAGHAGYVEFGTGVRGSAGAGPYDYDPDWPGMVAQPYLRPALDTARGEMLGEFALRMRF